MYQAPWFTETKHQTTLGRISYFNAVPVYFGLEKLPELNDFRIENHPPTILNRMLEAGRLDISPVSVTAYARNSHHWLILPELSISCNGPVMSVLLVSRIPLEKLDQKTVLMTSDSAAAADLLKLICAKKRISPFFTASQVQHPDNLGDSHSAALVIGDAALAVNWQDYYPYVYDLGQRWHQLTGQPFVFAVWAVRRKFAKKNPAQVQSAFAAFLWSKKEGLAHIQTIAEQAARKLGIAYQTAFTYFSRLNYDLNDLELMGLNTFFETLYEYGLLGNKVSARLYQNNQLSQEQGGE